MGSDANLFVGRIRPENFPHIFGETEDQPLDVDITRRKFEALTDEINLFLSKVGDVFVLEH